jgi:oligopeptide/dipeptide ABC transporter ATP-binding protein
VDRTVRGRRRRGGDGAVQEELAQWELSEPFGNGPFEVGSMNEQRMELVPHDGHPASDAINFDSYTLEYITTNQNVWQAIRSGNVDGVPSTFAPQEVADSFPDHVIQTLHPSYTGFGLHFNHDNPHFSKRPVRQAIAHVVDREQVARNSGANTKTPVEVVNGLPPSTQDEWFGDSSMFAAYEPDPGRAAQLLEEAGYQRQGNVWQGSDGPIEATLITRADFSDWVTAAQTVASQLTNFGMDIQLQTMEGPTFDETFERGDFELAGGGWGSGPYPLFSFENFYDEEARSAIHYPEEVTVPEVGSDSGELAVNFPETLSTLTQSAENHEETFRQLAWAFNQDLPVLPIQEKMLECVGMTPAHDYAARYPHQLSGGEKQRAALVRALLMNPDLVLADEAVSALDVSLRVEMMDLMLDLQDDFGTSYVFVSHDLSNARYFAEHAGGRIGVMYLGELVELGPAEDIVQNPRHPHTQVLTWATPDIDPAKATVGEPPVRRIDVPDPRDPPSGCRFHTRCPEARAVCPREHPELMDAGPDHGAACFRVEEDHPYWESPPLEDVDESSGGAGEAGGLTDERPLPPEAVPVDVEHDREADQ